jgi:recombination protein RecA
MISACSSGQINVIVLDSVANLVPSRVMENGADKETVAELARVLSRTMGKLLSYAASNNVLVILINQLREKVGVMFGSPDTMPGGKALKHACSCILKVTKLESSSHCISIQDDSGSERIIGKYSSVIIEKNRFAKPHFGSMKVPIYYEPYFPNIEDVCFNSGRDLKIIKVRNNIYSWKNIKTEGRSAFVEMIKNPEVIDELILIIKDEAKKQSMSLPIEIINFDISDYKKNSKKFINKKSISDEKEEIKNQVSEEVEDFDIDSNE